MIAVGSTLWSTGEHGVGCGSRPGKLFSLVGIAPASYGSSGWSGGCCREYRPPRFPWRSAEGSVDGGLALVKVRTSPEGCAHAR